MSEWKDSIISYIDLLGISKKLHEKSHDAIKKMREMHRKVHKLASFEMPMHDYVYYWNDSILLTAIVSQHKDYELVMREVDMLKRFVDKIYPSYAVCVKGKIIPGPNDICEESYHGKLQNKLKVIYIKASSLAFANCFLIEKNLSRRYAKHWYIDKRIISKIKISPPSAIAKTTLFPRKTRREVFMYNGYLWD